MARAPEAAAEAEPLVAAASKLDALSEQDANVHAKNNNGWTALLLAARNGHLPVVELLLLLLHQLQSP